ncbi:MAG: phosphoenolpyruvate--protein phosphotransferase [Deltaproteobacteria bacterium RIFCSPLOWO2_02_FULL_44_10]|nr:MAG: phosphoenolpyruvate--protein phosphotransferase [Deltaproteobacteria bacterium RIFCSPHIGHO2_02_FULL_44_16]OGQ47040.1 MAG: phosphoenolpyruvate--protein phosphotransferase [Deltaproteobacteria bacterium RIFCSPLOWO2_02_FULL_44_10]
MTKQRRFHSHAMAPGIAIGKAHRLARRGFIIPHYWIQDKHIVQEIKRFRQALQKTRSQLSSIQAKLCRIQGHEQIGIIESHRLFLKDDLFVAGTIDLIQETKINAEWALEKIIAQLKLSFLSVQDDFFRDRQQDIEQTGYRVISHLIGNEDIAFSSLPEGPLILIAHDIAPAEVVMIPREHVLGFVTESGGEASHTAIISRTLEIPAILGVSNALDMIRDGETIVLDGMKGLVIASPAKKELQQYKMIQRKYEALEQLLMQDIHLPTVTKDGVHIRLEANIEFVSEVTSAIQHGAEGIGLYRTEFLFLNRLHEPSEEEQIENYMEVLKRFHPRPVTIRTLDLGADKLGLIQDHEEEQNPALGLRAIRLCLREKTLFKTQLKALLRASTIGNLRILIPLVSHVEEIRQVKKILQEVQKDLKRKKIPFAEKIPLGIMIEIPSAAIMADQLAKEVDFFSIGTNDLLQYSLAIDRTNELVSHLFTPYHPFLFRLLQFVVAAGERRGIPVSVCGEVAADPLMIGILAGLKFDSLSMNSVSIPRAKKIVRSLSSENAEKLFGKVMSLSSAEEVEHLLRLETKKMPKTVQELDELSASLP